MLNSNSLTGIILAGGDSSRLGQDKGLLVLDGKTLLERAIGVLSPFCDMIMVSSANPGHRIFNCALVPDILPGKGPMMGIFSALTASGTAMNLIMAVDNAGVGPEFFSYVLSKDLIGYDAAVPFLDERYYEPLVGFYSKSILEPMSRMIGRGCFKLPDLFRQVNVLHLDVVHDSPGFSKTCFESVNTG